MITIIVISVLSVSLNVLLLWYLRKMTRDLLFVSETMGDLFEDINDFSSHIENVHSLETFYGDETLQNLIRHSRDLLVEFDQYEDILDLTREIELEVGLEDEIDDETED